MGALPTATKWTLTLSEEEEETGGTRTVSAVGVAAEVVAGDDDDAGCGCGGMVVTADVDASAVVGAIAVDSLSAADVVCKDSMLIFFFLKHREKC